MPISKKKAKGLIEVIQTEGKLVMYTKAPSKKELKIWFKEQYGASNKVQ
jgi:hypothetical protein